MNDANQTSIHETMWPQRISILKRRFDVLCRVRVTADSTQDGTLAKHFVDSHMRPHPEVQDQDQGGATKTQDLSLTLARNSFHKLCFENTLYLRDR
jgi:DNA replicative helicase MCM subunit Mcm2 (Cdc46/Mcm family)